MRTYTTCASCAQQLEQDHHGQLTHAGCPPSPRPIDALERAFLAALLAGEQEAANALADQLDGYQQRPPDLLGAALIYASWGWPVFPCRPGHKRPITEHGFREASTDAEVVAGWWRRTPTANIGLATGQAFDCLDVDPGGLRAWVNIRMTYTQRDIHGLVSTPRGGLHVYLPATGGGSLAGFHPHLDYRGAGGYVLAPPSALVPAALGSHPVPPWRLTYTWQSYPSPAISGPRAGQGVLR